MKQSWLIAQINTPRLAGASKLLTMLKFTCLLCLFFIVDYMLMRLLPYLHLAEKWQDVLSASACTLLLFSPVLRLVAMGESMQADTADLELYRTLVEQTLQGVMVTDVNLNILYVNAGFCTATGYSRAEATGQTPRLLQSGRHDAQFYKQMWQLIRETGQWEGEIWNRRKDGTEYAEWLNISAIKDRADRITHYVGIFMDITQHKVMEQQLKESNRKLIVLTNTDSLTQVASRRFFDETLASQWDAHLREVRPLSVIMIDIDSFKEYNDAYGHVAGDQCLKTIARQIQSEINGRQGLVGRYGGEEFGVILPNTAGEDARMVAERLRLSVMDQRILHGASKVSSYVTISLGVSSTVPAQNALRCEFLETADQALYAAKQGGRNQVRMYGS